MLPQDVQAADATVATLLAHVQDELSIPLTKQTSGDRVVVATSPSLAASVLASNGTFGRSAGFAAAMDGLPSTVVGGDVRRPVRLPAVDPGCAAGADASQGLRVVGVRRVRGVDRHLRLRWTVTFG